VTFNPEKIARLNELQKKQARAKAQRAMNSGKILQPDDCEDCGKSSQVLVKHHENYRKPLEVVWLCEPCHNKRHGRYRGYPFSAEEIAELWKTARKSVCS